jgi:hypothetical protein
MGDTQTQDAAICNPEVIGEATKNLSKQLRTEYTDIPWKNIDTFGLRSDSGALFITLLHKILISSQSEILIKT